MFVKLVVVDDRDYAESDWTICCGAGVYDVLTEQLVGDDREAPPDWAPSPEASPEEALAQMQAHEKAHRNWEARHFPNLHDGDQSLESGERFRSRDYVACLLLGITGWSGYDDEAGRYWACTPEALTAEGKALYEQLQALYPGCTLHLLTFLDT